MKDPNSPKIKPSRLVHWMRGWIHLTATVLILIGFFLLSTWWSTRNSSDWWLDWHNPLVRISDRAILAIGGISHLTAAVYLFTARSIFNRTLAIVCAGMNNLIYYVGLRLVGPAALPNTERFFGWRLRLQPTIVDFRWKLLITCLLMTGIALLALNFWDSRKLTKDAWLLEWQKMRSQQPKEMPISKRPQPVRDYAKIVCSHCGQKISFPVSRLGENTLCPRCAGRITLQEPPAQMV